MAATLVTEPRATTSHPGRGRTSGFLARPSCLFGGFLCNLIRLLGFGVLDLGGGLVPGGGFGPLPLRLRLARHVDRTVEGRAFHQRNSRGENIAVYIPGILNDNRLAAAYVAFDLAFDRDVLGLDIG